MFAKSFDNIADVVLKRRKVYPLDVESLIRELANRLSATAFMETIAKLDDRDPKFAQALSELCRSLPPKNDSYIIGFGDIDAGKTDEEATPDTIDAAEYYLRLVFENEDAARYQFELFPDMDAEFIVGGSRKRVGAMQYVRLEVRSSEFLQTFLENCRRNKHLLRIEESSVEAFNAGR